MSVVFESRKQVTVRSLFVTNDPVLSQFAKVHLGGDEDDVVTAATADEAWAKFSDDKFGVIAIDLALEASGGFRLLKRLRSQPLSSDTPVIVGADREDVTSVERAFDLGATSFFGKPVNWRLFHLQLRFVWRTHQTEVQRREAEIEAITRGVLRDSSGLLTEAMHGSEAMRTKAREYADVLGKLSRAHSVSLS